MYSVLGNIYIELVSINIEFRICISDRDRSHRVKFRFKQIMIINNVYFLVNCVCLNNYFKGETVF